MICYISKDYFFNSPVLLSNLNNLVYCLAFASACSSEQTVNNGLIRCKGNFCFVKCNEGFMVEGKKATKDNVDNKDNLQSDFLSSI